METQRQHPRTPDSRSHRSAPAFHRDPRPRAIPRTPAVTHESKAVYHTNPTLTSVNKIPTPSPPNPPIPHPFPAPHTRKKQPLSGYRSQFSTTTSSALNHRRCYGPSRVSGPLHDACEQRPKTSRHAAHERRTRATAGCGPDTDGRSARVTNGSRRIRSP